MTATHRIRLDRFDERADAMTLHVEMGLGAPQDDDDVAEILTQEFTIAVSRLLERLRKA